MLVNLVITNWPGANTIKASIIATGVLLLFSFKSLLSIRAIGHYKNGMVHSKIERSVFIAGFCVVAVFAVVSFFFCLFVVIPEDFTNYRDADSRAPVSYSEIGLDFSAFATVLCCVFLAVFDLILLKALRERYYNSLHGIRGRR